MQRTGEAGPRKGRFLRAHSIGGRLRRGATLSIAALCITSVTLASSAKAAPVPGESAAETLAAVTAAQEALGIEQAIESWAEDRGGSLSLPTEAGIHEISDVDGEPVLELGGSGVKLTLPVEGGTSSAAQLSDGTSVFPGGDHDLALQAQADGAVRAQAVIAGPEAPHEVRYELSLPEGVRAVLAEDGGVDLLESFVGEDEELLTSRFEAPWAVDANGMKIGGHYDLRDGALVQVVSATERTAYPVVADPFWVPAIIIAIRVGVSVTVKVGTKTAVKYVKAPSKRVVTALQGYKQLSWKAGDHTFRLEKERFRHILERHHPKYWNGTEKAKQTFFNPNMSVEDVRALIDAARKNHTSTLRYLGDEYANISMEGVANGVKYFMKIEKGKIVQFYPK